MHWRLVLVAALVAGTQLPTRQLRVLVAERDDATRAEIAATLERAGFRVVARCADAAAAVSALGRRGIDVCLIDLDLPGGGVTAGRAIAERAGRPLILILASSAREREIFAAHRAGADSFVVKDVDAAALPEHVAAVAAGDAVLPHGVTARLIEEFRALAVHAPPPEGKSK
jgi:DNA-binding NarL/FixJ family response regulator